jgi:chromosome segregation ATPase
MSDICEHGSLKRQCNTCDLNQHISELCKDLDAANEEIEWLRAEMEERNRIIGMSREREARHLAEIKKLKEDVHLANGVADLAIKHRDAAEADVVARQALITRLTQESNMHARACAKVFDELQEVKQERNEIINETCAAVCEMLDLDIYEADMCAAAIRALKE